MFGFLGVCSAIVLSFAFVRVAILRLGFALSTNGSHLAQDDWSRQSLAGYHVHFHVFFQTMDLVLPCCLGRLYT
jgi:hypothetical protein